MTKEGFEESVMNAAVGMLPPWDGEDKLGPDESYAFSLRGEAATKAGYALREGPYKGVVVPSWVRAAIVMTPETRPCNGTQDHVAERVEMLGRLDPEVAEAEWRLTGKVTLP